MILTASCQPLEPTHDQQDDQHDNDHTDDPARAIAPGAAMAPGGQHADESENKNDQDDDADTHRRPPERCPGAAPKDKLRRDTTTKLPHASARRSETAGIMARTIPGGAHDEEGEKA